MYLDQDAAGDLPLQRGQRDSLEQAVGLTDGECGNFADIEPVDAHSPGFSPQTGSFAVRTFGVTPVFAQHHPHVQLVFLPLQKGEEAVDPEERSMPIQHECLLGRRQLPPRRVQRNAVLHRGFSEL